MAGARPSLPLPTTNHRLYRYGILALLYRERDQRLSKKVPSLSQPQINHRSALGIPFLNPCHIIMSASFELFLENSRIPMTSDSLSERYIRPRGQSCYRFALALVIVYLWPLYCTGNYFLFFSKFSNLLYRPLSQKDGNI